MMCSDSPFIPVVLAGGSGSRLWPLSRDSYPKQFLPLMGESSMLQQTLNRVADWAAGESLVVCNDEHRFIVAEQLRGYSNSRIIIEPEGKNTAPSVALAALQLAKHYPNTPAVMLVLPADHHIADEAGFQRAITALLPAVEAGKFATLGISPDSAHCGYGYIKTAGAVTDSTESAEPTESARSVFSVDQFVEKPNIELARQYLQHNQTQSAASQWLWNSGVFLMRADRYLDALQRLQPAMYAACECAVLQQTTDLDFIRIDADAFLACPADSIDYAVMESLASEGQVVVSKLDGGWSDIGSWSSLAQQYPADDNNNVVIGHGQNPPTVFEDSRNTIVCGDERLIATLGIDNLIIADTPEALLVARRDQDQNIKQLLKTLKRGADSGEIQPGSGEIQPGLSSRIGHRPWGYYQVVTYGDGYKVKKICVNPGASLSLQRHQHRAEHWVVVSGCAQVTRGAEIYSVKQNQSTYISPREVHKLENNSCEPLVIIEVQTGSYLEEDDIERLEDRYGR